MAASQWLTCAAASVAVRPGAFSVSPVGGQQAVNVNTASLAELVPVLTGLQFLHGLHDLLPLEGGIHVCDPPLVLHSIASSAGR